jgi:hypothetical protein
MKHVLKREDKEEDKIDGEREKKKKKKRSSLVRWKNAWKYIVNFAKAQQDSHEARDLWYKFIYVFNILLFPFFFSGGYYLRCSLCHGLKTTKFRMDASPSLESCLICAAHMGMWGCHWAWLLFNQITISLLNIYHGSSLSLLCSWVFN